VQNIHVYNVFLLLNRLYIYMLIRQAYKLIKMITKSNLKGDYESWMYIIQLSYILQVHVYIYIQYSVG